MLTALLLPLWLALAVLAAPIDWVSTLAARIGRAVRDEPDGSLPTDLADIDYGLLPDDEPSDPDQLVPRLLELQETVVDALVTASGRDDLQVIRDGDAVLITSPVLEPHPIGVVLDPKDRFGVTMTFGTRRTSGTFIDDIGSHVFTAVVVLALRHGAAFRRDGSRTLALVCVQPGSLWWDPRSNGILRREWHTELPGRPATPEEISRYLG